MYQNLSSIFISMLTIKRKKENACNHGREKKIITIKTKKKVCKYIYFFHLYLIKKR